MRASLPVAVEETVEAEMVVAVEEAATIYEVFESIPMTYASTVAMTIAATTFLGNRKTGQP
jgi:hypothetical protein